MWLKRWPHIILLSFSSLLRSMIKSENIVDLQLLKKKRKKKLEVYRTSEGKWIHWVVPSLIDLEVRDLTTIRTRFLQFVKIRRRTNLLHHKRTIVSKTISHARSYTCRLFPKLTPQPSKQLFSLNYPKPYVWTNGGNNITHIWGTSFSITLNTFYVKFWYTSTTSKSFNKILFKSHF